MSAKNNGAAPENPLVPHAFMLRLYDAMKRLRALKPRASAKQASGSGVWGEEACRSSSLLSLAAGDLVSDVPGSALETVSLRRRGLREELAPGTIALRPAAEARERVMLGLGAASALRAQGESRLVLAYVEGQALTGAMWKQVLGVAGEAELPIIFLLLPVAGGGNQGGISDRAQGWGVPGMPVDAADAVALYRVMQESVLRARGGDGPALIECVAWRAGDAEVEDGVAAMRQVLAQRGLLGRR